MTDEEPSLRVHGVEEVPAPPARERGSDPVAGFAAVLAALALLVAAYALSKSRRRG